MRDGRPLTGDIQVFVPQIAMPAANTMFVTPVRDRALLADALLESLDDDAARNVQLAWAAEAEDRIEAYRRGDLSAVDGPNSLKELRSRYRA